ncbi:MAG: hypothetical protein J6A97_05865 [Clostridia bacterium]|nr:hypothetical protein [Clostridia bacterium]
MAELKNWGLLLLFLSAGSLIYCFLLPSGTVSKTAKSVISVVLMSLVFLPLFSAFGNMNSDDFGLSGEYETENYDYFLEESVRTAAEEVIRTTVRKFTAVPYKTEIFINKTEDGSINIEYVGITFEAKPQFEEKLGDALYEALGIIPDIRVELTDE